MKYTYEWINVEDSEVDNTIELLNKKGAEGYKFTGYTADTGHSITFLMEKVE